MSDFDRMIADVAADAGVAPPEVAHWTPAQWDHYLVKMEARHTAETAALVRAGAACAEAKVCGCRIEVEVDDDLRPMFGTERVRHTCGREAS